MSEEQLKSFIAKIQEDKALQEKLQAADGVDAVVAIALEAGYSIDAQDLESSSLVAQELSAQDLESVSGGWPTADYRTCACTGLFTGLIKVCPK